MTKQYSGRSEMHVTIDCTSLVQLCELYRLTMACHF